MQLHEGDIGEVRETGVLYLQVREARVPWLGYRRGWIEKAKQEQDPKWSKDHIQMTAPGCISYTTVRFEVISSMHLKVTRLSQEEYRWRIWIRGFVFILVQSSPRVGAHILFVGIAAGKTWNLVITTQKLSKTQVVRLRKDDWYMGHGLMLPKYLTCFWQKFETWLGGHSFCRDISVVIGMF